MNATEAEIAWAAGIFEGEGCISLGSRNLLAINMTDEDIIRRFHGIVGVGTVRGPLPGQRPEHKPFWDWRVCNQQDRELVLRAFLPWLGERRAAKAAAMLALPRTGRGPNWTTQCSGGHPLVGPDADIHTWRGKDGKTKRICRPCARERMQARRASKRLQHTGANA